MPTLASPVPAPRPAPAAPPEREAPERVRVTTRAPRGLLQRCAACGGAGGADGECDECRRRRLQRQSLQRSASGAAPAAVPAEVHRTLRTPGAPLDAETRAFMERRMGHDFARVRVHADPAAAASARAVAARAYTVGEHVVFGAGEYAPGTRAGRRLLAHELAHVAQQRAGGGALQPLAVSPGDHPTERDADRVADAALAEPAGAEAGQPAAAPAPVHAAGRLVQRRNIFQEIAGLFRGDDIPVAELVTYVGTLTTTGRIEDFTDSDNKARAVVRIWRTGTGPFTLTPALKILLIREMISGFTGNDDEQMILEILERSTSAELSTIFGPTGVPAAELNDDVHGEEWSWLQDFYRRRFEGGMAAVLRGSVVPKGLPVPLGAPLGTAAAPEAAPLTQGAEQPCNAEQRQGANAERTCCTAPMLREIENLRTRALPLVHGAALRLASDPSSVAGPLWDHFRVRPDDTAHVGTILARLEDMMQVMAGAGDVRFVCWDSATDAPCNGGRTPASTSPTCEPAGTVFIRLCGDYGGSPFLSGGEWLEILIHEYAHASCPGNGLILPAGEELYAGRGGYPPPAATAVRNADSYSNFATAVGAGAAPRRTAGGFPVPLTVAQAMTPWELSQVPAASFAPQPGDSPDARGQRADLARAARAAERVIRRFRLRLDPDRGVPVAGRAPTPMELSLLDRQLGRMLALPGVREHLGGPGGRGLPTGPGGTPTLAGRLRIVEDVVEFGLKRYELELLVLAGPNRPDIDDVVRDLWREFGLAPGPRGPGEPEPAVTGQERRSAMLYLALAHMDAPAFYHPGDDLVYLSRFVNFLEEQGAHTVRHETSHLLGGRSRTVEAFVARYGRPRFLPFWATFEEGTAEILARESAEPARGAAGPVPSPCAAPATPQPAEPAAPPAAVPPPGETTVTVEQTPAYEEAVGIVCRIMNDATVGRAGVLRAYFTGDIPPRVFELLEAALGPHP